SAPGPAPSPSTRTPPSAWSAPRSAADAATPTSDTSSPTARPPRACATASTPSPSPSSRSPKASLPKPPPVRPASTTTSTASADPTPPECHGRYRAIGERACAKCCAQPHLPPGLTGPEGGKCGQGRLGGAPSGDPLGRSQHTTGRPAADVQRS